MNKKITMNETIRMKMVRNEKNWISDLTKEEKDLVIKIWEVDEDTLKKLKKEYPDLCFILSLWKIASKSTLDYDTMPKGRKNEEHS